MAYRVTNVQGLIELMRDLQGSRSSVCFARSLGISPQYLCDIYKQRKLPSGNVLSSLGVTASYSFPETITAQFQRRHGEKKCER
jgi:hypothetical protein